MNGTRTFSTQWVTHVTPLAAQIHGHKRDIDRRAMMANTRDPTPLHSSVTGSRISVTRPSSLRRGGNAMKLAHVCAAANVQIQNCIFLGQKYIYNPTFFPCDYNVILA